jgi:hypothetical protein
MGKAHVRELSINVGFRAKPDVSVLSASCLLPTANTADIWRDRVAAPTSACQNVMNASEIQARRRNYQAILFLIMPTIAATTNRTASAAACCLTGESTDIDVITHRGPNQLHLQRALAALLRRHDRKSQT